MAEIEVTYQRPIYHCEFNSDEMELIHAAIKTYMREAPANGLAKILNGKIEAARHIERDLRT